MKAITVRQPWASCIRHEGPEGKRIENRGRPTSHRGQLAIHAGKTPDTLADTDPRITQLFGRDPRVGMPMGAVLAVAQLVDCHQASGRCCAPWGEAHYMTGGRILPAFHLVLADVVALPRPIPARGALSVPWKLPEDVSTQVLSQLGEQVAL
ncbi:hypothetical protein AB0J14_04485 [Micromonospora arborensis]|uniref:hypothetical protein n=1 Tax=Micromonospora arborensis TaxID=2116518 RepID=UPI0033DFAAB1